MENLKKGKLKIFFGYCAGVGKTYAMLAAAHERKKAGIDVICGYIERHDRADTLALINNLEEIATTKLQYKNIVLHEFDVDATLKRNPQLVLVDELAHTNAIGSRHKKRYSDIQELLHAGIDVYTTLNVQHLESLQDVVEKFTHICVNERIPDSVFDQAEQVEVVDIEPEDLLRRLKDGKIYKGAQVHRAMGNFFIYDNLVALREIALRRCADRVNKIASVATRSHTKEHIMLCLSPSPSNGKVIRTAARMAAAFHSEFTALYVETPNFENLAKKQKKILAENCRLAQQLGANIVHVFGENVAEQISEYANIAAISKIVIGRSYHTSSFFAKKTLVDHLTRLAPNIDIYIIPDYTSKKGYNERGNYQQAPVFNIIDSIISLSFLLMATFISFLFFNMGYTESNIIMIYILAILFISFMTKHKIYGIISSILIIFLFNFCFIEPRFSFQAYDRSYPITFTIMLIVSIITNTMTHKARQQTRELSLQAHRMEVLLKLSQNLQTINNRHDLAKEICMQLFRLLNKTIIIYQVKNGKLQDPFLYNEFLSEQEEEIYCSANEKAVAIWVMKNNKKAGVSTSTLSAAKALYFSLRTQNHIYAVIGIAMQPNEQLPPFEQSILTTMLNEIAIVMENIEQKPSY